MKTHSAVRLIAPLLLLAAFAGSAFAQGTPTNHRRNEGASAAPVAMATPAKNAAKAAAAKIDLNSATREQLVAVPGIGEAIADKIIAARPFKMKSELLQKGLVNKAQYSKLSPHVIARQS